MKSHSRKHRRNNQDGQVKSPLDDTIITIPSYDSIIDPTSLNPTWYERCCFGATRESSDADINDNHNPRPSYHNENSLLKLGKDSKLSLGDMYDEESDINSEKIHDSLDELIDESDDEKRQRLVKFHLTPSQEANTSSNQPSLPPMIPGRKSKDIIPVLSASMSGENMILSPSNSDELSYIDKDYVPPSTDEISYSSYSSNEDSFDDDISYENDIDSFDSSDEIMTSSTKNTNLCCILPFYLGTLVMGSTGLFTRQSSMERFHRNKKRRSRKRKNKSNSSFNESNASLNESTRSEISFYSNVSNDSHESSIKDKSTKNDKKQMSMESNDSLLLSPQSSNNDAVGIETPLYFSSSSEDEDKKTRKNTKKNNNMVPLPLSNQSFQSIYEHNLHQTTYHHHHHGRHHHHHHHHPGIDEAISEGDSLDDNLGNDLSLDEESCIQVYLQEELEKQPKSMDEGTNNNNNNTSYFQMYIQEELEKQPKSIDESDDNNNMMINNNYDDIIMNGKTTTSTETTAKTSTTSPFYYNTYHFNPYSTKPSSTITTTNTNTNTNTSTTTTTSTNIMNYYNDQREDNNTIETFYHNNNHDDNDNDNDDNNNSSSYQSSVHSFKSIMTLNSPILIEKFKKREEKFYQFEIQMKKVKKIQHYLQLHYIHNSKSGDHNHHHDNGDVVCDHGSRVIEFYTKQHGDERSITTDITDLSSYGAIAAE